MQTSKFSIELNKAKASATSMAFGSRERGLLFKEGISEEDEDPSNCDWETLETIVSLTMDCYFEGFSEDECSSAESLLLEYLRDKFPAYS